MQMLGGGMLAAAGAGVMHLANDHSEAGLYQLSGSQSQGPFYVIYFSLDGEKLTEKTQYEQRSKGYNHGDGEGKTKTKTLMVEDVHRDYSSALQAFNARRNKYHAYAICNANGDVCVYCAVNNYRKAFEERGANRGTDDAIDFYRYKNR